MSNSVQIDANNNVTNVGYIQLNDQTAPAAPAAGNLRIYKKTGSDGIFIKSSDGNESNLTSSVSSANATASMTSSDNATIPSALDGLLLTNISVTNATTCFLINIDGDNDITTLADCVGRVSGLSSTVTCAGQTANFTGTGITVSTNVTFYGRPV